MQTFTKRITTGLAVMLLALGLSTQSNAQVAGGIAGIGGLGVGTSIALGIVSLVVLTAVVDVVENDPVVQDIPDQDPDPDPDPTPTTTTTEDPVDPPTTTTTATTTN